MLYLNKKYITCFLAYLFPLIICQANITTISRNNSKTIKESGDSLYRAGKYRNAISVYSSILKQEGISPDIYYNLGNCYYRINDIPNAILHYERALKLDPADSDVRYNLSIAREKIPDKNVVHYDTFISAWWNSIANLFDLTTLKIISFLSFTLLLVIELLVRSDQLHSLKKTLRYCEYICLTICILSNLAAFQQYHNIVKSNGAIVMVEHVSIKSSPTDVSTDLFVLHSGSRIEITDNSMMEWCRVKYDDAKQGWIKKNNIEII